MESVRSVPGSRLRLHVSVGHVPRRDPRLPILSQIRLLERLFEVERIEAVRSPRLRPKDLAHRGDDPDPASGLQTLDGSVEDRARADTTFMKQEDEVERVLHRPDP